MTSAYGTLPVPEHHAVTGRRYERTLWIGTSEHESLLRLLPAGLELVRLGSRAFWALEATAEGLRPHLLAQVMTSDGDLIRGLTPADTSAAYAIDVAAAEDRLERPVETAFATATDLREWLTAPMWSRTMSVREGFLVAWQPLPWPDRTTGVWSVAPSALNPVLEEVFRAPARLEARLSLSGVVRTRELVRKPLLRNHSVATASVALSA